MIAAAAKNPLLAITPEEGKMLAVAVIDLGKQYAVTINPRVLAWVNLTGAALAVYGPKVLYVVMARQARPAAPVGGSAPAGSIPPVGGVDLSTASGDNVRKLNLGDG